MEALIGKFYVWKAVVVFVVIELVVAAVVEHQQQMLFQYPNFVLKETIYSMKSV